MTPYRAAAVLVLVVPLIALFRSLRNTYRLWNEPPYDLANTSARQADGYDASLVWRDPYVDGLR